jgi:DNA-binding protein H-NS
LTAASSHNAISEKTMISNLASARALVQADLEHARNVLDLWAHQVAELEKALQQIDAVSNSRNTLRVQYQGPKANSPALQELATASTAPKRGRKPDKAGSTSAASRNVGRTGRRGRKPASVDAAGVNRAKAGAALRPRTVGAAKKGTAPAQAKYKDPNSEKTWAGRGRRPDWLIGDPAHYAIRSQGEETGAPAQAGSGSQEAHERSQATA